MAQNIKIAVGAPHLDVAIVGAMPLIDVIGYLHHPTVEAKSLQLFGAAFIHVAFDLDLHDVLVFVAKLSTCQPKRRNSRTGKRTPADFHCRISSFPPARDSVKN